MRIERLGGSWSGLVAACLLLQLVVPSPVLANTNAWRCALSDDGRHRCEAALTRPTGQNSHPHADLDWWSLEDLSDDAATATHAHCPGVYIEPPPASAEATQAPENVPLRANADKANLLEDQSRVQLEGNVSLRQGYRLIRADQLDYFRNQDRIELTGNIEVREPGMLLRGESAEFNPQTGEGALNGAAYVLHEQHAHGHAERIKRRADGIIKVSQGSYTYCPPGSEDWQLQAERIQLDTDEGRGVARDAKLRVGDVPVLYTPYLSFPMDDRRLSGFLWPHLGYTADSGADVSIPYYLNLAPNYDLTLIPRYIGDRGVMATAEGRYLNRWSDWLAAGSHLADDDEADRDRWLYNVQQSGRTLNGFSTHIDYTEVSDDDYFQDLSNGGLSVRRMSQLNQLAQVDYRLSGWNVQVKAQEFQTLDDDLDEPYQMLPRIEVAREFQDQSFAADYRLLSHFTRFDGPNSNRVTGDRVTGDRFYAEPGLRFPMYWTAGFLVPTLKYRHVEYDIDVVKAGADDSPSIGSAVASLDSGLFFERESELLGSSLLQTLEPRAYYLWADEEDHTGIPDFDTADLTFSFSQLFRDTRFSGYDRLADANQLSLAVTSRFIDASSGLERFAASIGQIRYFDDREVTVSNRSRDVERDSKSQIASEISFRPGTSTWIDASLLWDPNEEQVEEGGVQFHWSDNRYLLNLGYRYRRQAPLIENGMLIDNDVDQVDTSGVLPIGRHWQLVARYQYDFTEEQSIEEMIGAEYNSCCWAIRMIYQEGLDRDGKRDEGFFMEFVLFGLGGIGDSINNVLRKSIREYDMTRTDYGF